MWHTSQSLGGRRCASPSVLNLPRKRVPSQDSRVEVPARAGRGRGLCKPTVNAHGRTQKWAGTAGSGSAGWLLDRLRERTWLRVTSLHPRGRRGVCAFTPKAEPGVGSGHPFRIYRNLLLTDPRLCPSPPICTAGAKWVTAGPGCAGRAAAAARS